MTAKKTHGGARTGAGRKTLEKQASAAEVGNVQQKYIDGIGRGVMIDLLNDGGAHPFQVMFDAMRFFYEQAGLAVLAAAGLEGEKRDAQIEKAAKNFIRASDQAHKVAPFGFPKLASVDHTGMAPQTLVIGGMDVELKSLLDRLAAGSRTRSDLLENVPGAPKSADLRLGLLEPAGTAGADAQPAKD